MEKDNMSVTHKSANLCGSDVF